MDKIRYNSLKLANSGASTSNTTMPLQNLAQEVDTDNSSSTFQPIDTTFLLVLVPIVGIIAIIANYINYLVLRMAKRDKSLLNCLLPDFAMNFLVGGPAIYIFGVIISTLSEPASDVIGVWFCHLYSILGYLWLFKAWLFSLLVSLLRYFYIVHNGRITEYGLARVERIFRILYWAVPTCLVILHTSLRTGYDPTPWANHCYGWPPGSSSTNTWWYQIERQFCVYNEYGFTNRYAERGLRIVCALNVGACILLFSNFVEAIVYYMIYRHMNR